MYQVEQGQSEGSLSGFHEKTAAEAMIVNSINAADAYNENNSDSDEEPIPVEIDSGRRWKEKRLRARFNKRKAEAYRQDKSKGKEDPPNSTADQPKKR